MGGVSSSGDDVERVQSLKFDEFWDEFRLGRDDMVVVGVGGKGLGRTERRKGGRETRRCVSFRVRFGFE